MNKWKIAEDSKDGIRLLIEFIRENYLALAKSPLQIIAIGEVWSALDDILNEDFASDSELNVLVSIGRRVRQAEHENGVFFNLRVNCNELTLDRLNTTYSKSTGSDWSSKTYLQITPLNSSFNEEIQEWISDLFEIIEENGIFLTASRDHT